MCAFALTFEPTFTVVIFAHVKQCVFVCFHDIVQHFSAATFVITCYRKELLLRIMDNTIYSFL